MTELVLKEVEVQRLNIQPGEILVVRTDTYLTSDQAKRIKEIMHDLFIEAGWIVPPFLVLDKGVNFEVVSQADFAGVLPN